MGKYDWVFPTVIIAGIGAGGLYLFMTSEGRRMLSSITAGASGYDDPFKYYEDDPDAWDPESKRYREIVRGTEKRAEKARKKIQKEYIEAYLADAF